jgi:hypothetical protein
MTRKEFLPYINGDDLDVSSVAADIAQLDDDYRSGAITKEMYQELVNDALELAKIRAEAKSLDTKIKMESLVDIVRQIAGIV